MFEDFDLAAEFCRTTLARLDCIGPEDRAGLAAQAALVIGVPGLFFATQPKVTAWRHANATVRGRVELSFDRVHQAMIALAAELDFNVAGCLPAPRPWLGPRDRLHRTCLAAVAVLRRAARPDAAPNSSLVKESTELILVAYSDFTMLAELTCPPALAGAVTRTSGLAFARLPALLESILSGLPPAYTNRH